MTVTNDARPVQGATTMPEKYFKAHLSLTEGDEGTVQAAISVFNTIDSVKDVVLPSFFTDGQAVPMSAWGHNWGALPPGRGTIRVTPDHAVFDGRFFLDTTHGRDHYNTIKQMAELQEWSFGYEITKAEMGEFQGQKVQFLVSGSIFEATPALVGANRLTHTIGIKDGQRLADHEALVRAQVPALIERWRSLDGRGEGKIGAAISRARRERIASLRDVLRSGADDLDGLLKETDPASSEDDGKGRLLFAAFLRDEARRLGVAV
jgi:hypothetical protein